MKKLSIRDLVLAALCLALCLVLPFLTGQIPEIGQALSPMHIPVLLCGFICGPWYGAVVGFIAPILRNLIFGMPPFPMNIPMAFELLTYGLVAGVIYRLLPKKPVSTYISLITAMLAGRVIWGVGRVILAGVQNAAFSWQMFIAGAFIDAVPGIICHIVLIPIIVIALEKAGLMHKRV